MSSAEQLYARLRAGHGWREHPPLTDADAAELRRRLAVAVGGSVDAVRLPVAGESRRGGIETMLQADARRLTGLGAEQGTADHVDLENMIVRVLDVADLNALSWLCDDGSSLIVVNDALITLLYDVARILAARSRLGDAVTDCDLTHDAAARHLRDAFEWLVQIGSPGIQGFAIRDDTAHLAGALAAHAERFLVAHEVAHVLLGHHGCGRTRGLLVELGITDEDEQFNLQEEELEADGTGLALMLVDAQRSRQPTSLPLIGAFLFIAVFHELQVREWIPSMSGSAYPSMEERMDVLRFTLQELAGDDNAAAMEAAAAGPLQLFRDLLDHRDHAPDRLGEAIWDELGRHSTSPFPDYIGFRQAMGELSAGNPIFEFMTELARAFIVLENRIAEMATRPPDGDGMTSFSMLKLIISSVGQFDRILRAGFCSRYLELGGTKRDIGALFQVTDDQLRSAWD
ncbi:hypothetical protein F4553_001875 [Allocatelliglobosispora scoriae]|uniref:IrrE N-terminal-like domain-containing protein n=1 Tax=Allocatelliglobosispora scoriae TaxID=643052 RepID=A0A841BMK7_9ACTN|nr:ImmA/IrrE family metallo-endopeptidase [Allocatelliglobosispora scoriae]MBB5868496.1 hypothetical protein [Allocatelliglobosispora scoriae]